MPKQKKNETSYDMPPGLAQPAIRALTAAGYTRLEQLAMAEEGDLQELHGMGPKGMSIIRAALKARGLAFADPDSTREVKAPKEQVFDNPTGWVRSHIKGNA